MKIYHLDDFIGGWVAGDFDPTIIKTPDFEVSVKNYTEGEYQERHVHYEADELSIIVKGSARMNEKVYKKGDIILMEKGEATDFYPLEDGTITCVIKTPSIPGDKHLVSETDSP
jgi:mannose-6-phosphate isomerase-like protein (cupin superfamily)